LAEQYYHLEVVVNGNTYTGLVLAIKENNLSLDHNIPEVVSIPQRPVTHRLQVRDTRLLLTPNSKVKGWRVFHDRCRGV